MVTRSFVTRPGAGSAAETWAISSDRRVCRSHGVTTTVTPGGLTCGQSHMWSLCASPPPGHCRPAPVSVADPSTQPDADPQDECLHGVSPTWEARDTGNSRLGSWTPTIVVASPALPGRPPVMRHRPAARGELARGRQRQAPRDPEASRRPLESRPPGEGRDLLLPCDVAAIMGVSPGDHG